MTIQQIQAFEDAARTAMVSEADTPAPQVRASTSMWISLGVAALAAMLYGIYFLSL